MLLELFNAGQKKSKSIPVSLAFSILQKMKSISLRFNNFAKS